MSTALLDARLQVPVIAKPSTSVPALAPVSKPTVAKGDEFPSMGWWWRVDEVDSARGTMSISPLRPTNKAQKLANAR